MARDRRMFLSLLYDALVFHHRGHPTYAIIVLFQNLKSPYCRQNNINSLMRDGVKVTFISVYILQKGPLNVEDCQETCNSILFSLEVKLQTTQNPGKLGMVSHFLSMQSFMWSHKLCYDRTMGIRSWHIWLLFIFTTHIYEVQQTGLLSTIKVRLRICLDYII